MTYKEIFQNQQYPKLLDTIDELQMSSLPPWEFIKKNYVFWKTQLEKSNWKYAPIARMINDDVIATINIENFDGMIYLFVLPVSAKSEPFKIFNNSDEWLKQVYSDSHDYLTNY